MQEDHDRAIEGVEVPEINLLEVCPGIKLLPPSLQERLDGHLQGNLHLFSWFLF